MRHTVTETLKTSSSTSETHNITYTYDNLNRLIYESASCSNPAGGYIEEYGYDVVGNRTYRGVIANGQPLTTEYRYTAGDDWQTDRLSKEIHTGPVAVVPIGDKQYYAYAAGSGISYRASTGEKIGQVKAYFMGLPNKLAQYLFAMVLICVPVTFFIPFISRLLRRNLQAC